MAIIRQYLNPYQGTIEAWVRPNWNGNDNKIHKIFHVDAEDTSCVLHLRFDEGSGNTAYDSSVYGNNGTIYGATWTDGVVGKGLRFDRDNVDIVNMPSGAIEFGKNSFTMMAWVKDFNHPNNSQSRIMGNSFYYTSIGRYIYLNIGYNNSTYIKPYIEATSSTHVSWGRGGVLNVYALDEFFIAGVIDRDEGKSKLYVNSNYGEKSVSDSDGEFSDESGGTTQFKIGSQGVVNLSINAIIDEPTIFNRALPASEIKSIYENGRTGFGLSKGKDNYLGFMIPGAGISVDISSWTAGSLHHVVATYDKDNITLFVDGTKYGPNPRDSKSVIAKVYGDMWIGNIMGKYQFDGSINLRTYSIPIPETANDALALGLPDYENVQSLYNNGSGHINFVNDTVMFQTAGYEFV